MSLKEKLIEIYDKKYKQLLMLSVLLFLASIGILVFQFVSTGEFVKRGVSLKGGLSMTLAIDKEVIVSELQDFFSTKFPKADVSVRSLSQGGKVSSLIIEASDLDEQDLILALKSRGFSIEKGAYSIENMGSALGENFFKDTIRAVIIAFLCMSVVVYITFRVPVPSLFVILCALSDIVSTLAVVSISGTKLSTAGIAAFLMLIGYSVDTDILLTTRVLKNKQGTVLEKTLDAMRTGTLMTATAILATIIGYFFTQSEVIQQIMLILSIGLFFDFFMTWIQNAGILRWYLERKNQVQHVKN